MYNWQYGENNTQRYYDVAVDGKYLLVFADKDPPNTWLGMINYVMIRDKTANDRQRKKQGLEKGCSVHLLQHDYILKSNNPEYMMKKVEHCFKRNKTEVCR